MKGLYGGIGGAKQQLVLRAHKQTPRLLVKIDDHAAR